MKTRVTALAALLAFGTLSLSSAAEPSLSSESIYQLSSSWTTQAGKTVKLPEFRGKPRLITMVYTSCQYSCPMVIEEVRKILNQLPEADRAKIGVTLVSFDSERDTAEQMRKFAEKRGLDPRIWTFLKGSPSSIREMATVLGISYKRIEGTAGAEYSHTNAIALLDSEGVIRFRQSSLGANGKEAAAELAKLIRR